MHNYTVSALEIISFRRISIYYVRFTESEQCFKRYITQLVHCNTTVPHSRVGLVATPRAWEHVFDPHLKLFFFFIYIYLHSCFARFKGNQVSYYLQRSRENVVPCKRLQFLFEFKFSWKMSERKNVGALGSKAKQIVLNVCNYF